MEVVVQADVASVARDAVERVITAAGRSMQARGFFTFVLAGGSSPAALYELLASPDYSGRIQWPNVQVFFGDERCVPPEHEWSNYGMARRLLLDRIPVPPQNVHRMPSVMPAGDAAVAYAETIGQVLRTEPPAFPHFDVILLGMGDDGHTASLFPGMPALDEREAWAVGTSVPSYVNPQVARVTLTLPVLNSAREVLFLVTGESKSERVREVLRGAERDPEAAELPASRVRPDDGTLTWVLDEPAASLLKER